MKRDIGADNPGNAADRLSICLIADFGRVM